MRVFKSIVSWQRFRDSLDRSKTLGVVPTMGALHEGHISLVKESISECDITLVSIFVNPTQFDDSEDLKKYPTDIESDLVLLEKEGVDFIILPDYEEIYADNYHYKIIESFLSQKLCGSKRPGHFDGVLTVVMKLLNISLADRAYFGEKDFQQLILIKEMVKTFFMKIEIIGLPTVRESDGLAMSSRNILLTKENREKAPQIYKLLKKKVSAEELKTEFREVGIEVDYLLDDLKFKRRLGAFKMGKVRLIDNVEL